MGSLLSRIRLIYLTLKSVSDSFSALSDRISRDPGLPLPNPSRSYWCEPVSPLDRHLGSKESTELPEYADVVIIGSGISGTAIARTLLDNHACSANKDTPLRVVMLEARDVCSGATGRNGGHISPNTYQDYAALAATHGASAAEAIIRFRKAHLPALIAVAEEEGLLRESQARSVEQFDVFLKDTLYARAKSALEEYLGALPDQRGKFTVHEDEAAFEELQLSDYVVGCLSQQGGALHPYRLITGILSRLLSSYPSFQLFTRTPCTGIGITTSTITNATPTSPHSGYLVSTPKGTLAAAHVVHATNAWASHLLPGMRRKIVPVCAHMTAQRPGLGLRGAAWAEAGAGQSSFVFYPSEAWGAFDYLTQLVPVVDAGDGDGGDEDLNKHHKNSNEHPAPGGELMFGGGAMLGGSGEAALMANVGIADDTLSGDFEVSAYLGGALERYFAWGAEGSAGDVKTNANAKPNTNTNTDTESANTRTSPNTNVKTANANTAKTNTNTDVDTNTTLDDGWGRGRMKAVWTGIIGISADGQPWVGRVPERISGRTEPGRGYSSSSSSLKSGSADSKSKAESASLDSNSTQSANSNSPTRSTKAKIQSTAPEAGAGLPLVRPGEWIAAGFTGEGMTHAWLAGVALARMISGSDDSESRSSDASALPPQFVITEKRWRNADIEAFLAGASE
ncbi:nucleotide-binding domain-containing protein [Mycena crocata]|nr:nucleotide-binding domain-containing protein [Mycena crocata]